MYFIEIMKLFMKKKPVFMFYFKLKTAFHKHENIGLKIF